MKVSPLLLSYLLIMTSCKNEKEKIKDKIISNSRVFVNSNIVNDDKADKLDAFVFIKSDTISEFEEAEMYSKYALFNGKRNMEIAKLEKDKAKIYKDINITLGKSSNDYFINSAIENYKTHLDSAIYYQKLAEKVSSKLLKLDTLKPIYLNNVFFTKVKMKNRSIQSDTINIITDTEGNIIESSQIMKNVASKYK